MFAIRTSQASIVVHLRTAPTTALRMVLARTELSVGYVTALKATLEEIAALPLALMDALVKAHALRLWERVTELAYATLALREQTAQAALACAPMAAPDMELAMRELVNVILATQA